MAAGVPPASPRWSWQSAGGLGRAGPAIARVRRSWRVILQAGVAATLAYALANWIGHENAFFAPIAALSTVATSLAHRLRRAGELVLGNAVGILLADLLIGQIGTGVWQLALVVVLALTIAIGLGGGPILIMQASSSGILIATLLPPTAVNPWHADRFVDALLGGAIGLAAAALLMPDDPARAVRRGTQPLLDTLARGYRGVGRALAQGDQAAAETVLADLRASAPALAEFESGLAATRETTQLSPWFWSQRGLLADYGLAGAHLDNALRNLRVLARHGALCLRRGEEVPGPVTTALGLLAEATDRLGGVLAGESPPGAAQGPLLGAVQKVSAIPAGAGNDIYAAALVAQVRLCASDLLRASGLTDEQTRDAIRALTP